jgi:hypothetical protein
VCGVFRRGLLLYTVVMKIRNDSTLPNSADDQMQPKTPLMMPCHVSLHEPLSSRGRCLSYCPVSLALLMTTQMDRLLRTRSNIGIGVPGFLQPPRSQSVRPTTFAPTPASQSPPACACSIVWLRIRPSESKSKTNSPVKALSGSTPRPNGSERAITPRLEEL